MSFEGELEVFGSATIILTVEDVKWKEQTCYGIVISSRLRPIRDSGICQLTDQLQLDT